MQDSYFIVFFFFFGCSMWDPSSLTRDQTQAPCIGHAKSQPLDFQESPRTPILNGYHQNPKVYMHAFSLPQMIEDMIILNNSNKLF